MAVEPGRDFFNEAHVHNRCSVDSQEIMGIELLPKCAERFTNKRHGHAPSEILTTNRAFGANLLL